MNEWHSEYEHYLFKEKEKEEEEIKWKLYYTFFSIIILNDAHFYHYEEILLLQGNYLMTFISNW